jgi:hypothetical protein
MGRMWAEIDEWISSDMSSKEKCKFAFKNKDLSAKIMM